MPKAKTPVPKPAQKESTGWDWSEFDRQREETRRQIGCCTYDELCFDEKVAEDVKEVRRIGDFSFDVVAAPLHSLQDNWFDISGKSGKNVVLMEVNEILRFCDVVRFAEESIPVFKHDFATDDRGEKVKGAMIFRRLGSGRILAAREALDRGLTLVRAAGDNKFRHIKTLADITKPARQIQPVSPCRRARLYL